MAPDVPAPIDPPAVPAEALLGEYVRKIAPLPVGALYRLAAAEAGWPLSAVETKKMDSLVARAAKRARRCRAAAEKQLGRTIEPEPPAR